MKEELPFSGKQRRLFLKTSAAFAGGVATIFLPGCSPTGNTEGQPAAAEPTGIPTVDPNGSGSQVEVPTLTNPEIQGTAENWINGVPAALHELKSGGLIDREVLPGLKITEFEHATIPGGAPIIYVSSSSGESGYVYAKATLSDGSKIPMVVEIGKNSEGKLVASGRMVALNADVKGDYSLNEFGGAKVLSFNIAENAGSVTVLPGNNAQGVEYKPTQEPGSSEVLFNLKEFWGEASVKQVVNGSGEIIAKVGKDVLEVKVENGFEQHENVSGMGFEVIDGPDGGTAVILMGADKNTIVARINPLTKEVNKDTPRLWAQEGKDVRFLKEGGGWQTLEGIRFDQIKLQEDKATGLVDLSALSDGSWRSVPVLVANLKTGELCRSDVGRQINPGNLVAHAGLRTGDGPNDWKVWNQDTKEWSDPSEMQKIVLNLGFDPLRNYSVEIFEEKEILRDNTLWRWPVAEKVDGDWRPVQRDYDFKSDDYNPRGKFQLEDNESSPIWYKEKLVANTEKRRGRIVGFERSLVYTKLGWAMVGVSTMVFSVDQFERKVRAIGYTNTVEGHNDYYVARVGDENYIENTDYKILNRLDPRKAVTLAVYDSFDTSGLELNPSDRIDYDYLYKAELFSQYKERNTKFLGDNSADRDSIDEILIGKLSSEWVG